MAEAVCKQISQKNKIAVKNLKEFNIFCFFFSCVCHCTRSLSITKRKEKRAFTLKDFFIKKMNLREKLN